MERLEDFTLQNESYSIKGNLSINGNLTINNGNLILINGNLSIYGDVTINNGSIIVNKILNFLKPNAKIFINGGNIIAMDLNSYSSIFIRNGNIKVDYLDLNKHLPSNIDSDGTIEVGKKSWIGNISCKNYLVSGFNKSRHINAKEDIYILGENNSYSINAREVFFAGPSLLNGYELSAVHLEYAYGLMECSKFKNKSES